MIGLRELAPSTTILAQPSAPVAQWIEHRSSKPAVTGSNPVGRALSEHCVYKEIQSFLYFFEE